MTRRLTEEYFENRTFYQIQSGSLIDNPDQRISSDVRCEMQSTYQSSWRHIYCTGYCGQHMYPITIHILTCDLCFGQLVSENHA